MRSGSSSSGWCLGAIADYAEAVRAPVSSVKAWRLRRMRLAFASGSRARVVSVLRYVDGPSFDRDFTLGTGRHGHADPGADGLVQGRWTHRGAHGLPHRVHSVVRAGSDDGLGFNVGTGFDVRITRHVAAGVDVRYHDARHVRGGFDYFTAMLDLSLRL